MSNIHPRHLAAVVGLLLVLFILLSFHVVYDVLEFIPKDELNFVDTFITVDTFLERFNEASASEQDDIQRTNLY